MVMGKGKDSPSGEPNPRKFYNADIHDSNASEESQTKVDQGLIFRTIVILINIYINITIFIVIFIITLRLETFVYVRIGI